MLGPKGGLKTVTHGINYVNIMAGNDGGVSTGDDGWYSRTNGFQLPIAMTFYVKYQSYTMLDVKTDCLCMHTKSTTLTTVIALSFITLFNCINQKENSDYIELKSISELSINWV